jgi:hypothetical protein
MYKVYLTNQPSGFPVELDGFLKFQQEAYNLPIEAIGRSLGNMAIIDGLIESGAPVTTTAGFVNIAGEIVFFKPGTRTATFDVTDEVGVLVYRGGLVKPVLKTRVAQYNNSGTGAYNYTDLKRVQTPAGGIVQRLARIEKILQPLLPYDVDGTPVYGSWLFWGRPATEIPDGWEAVPDEEWKGKVPVVFDGTQVEFNEVGKVGGSKAVILTKPQMPKHTHPSGTLPRKGDRKNGDDSGGKQMVQISGWGDDRKFSDLEWMGESGNDEPHNNLQPYKVVLFIRFIG